MAMLSPLHGGQGRPKNQPMSYLLVAVNHAPLPSEQDQTLYIDVYDTEAACRKGLWDAVIRVLAQDRNAPIPSNSYQN
jgi:hypothetical protein